ncbi:hypothetical protein C8K18_101805 [Paraburkholderia sp. GV068]|uniref:hypothetical protein n=1 Tax=unclassified Paraburkholderia TaxID=2615204 RepID=UPI000D307D67|nr:MULTISPECIES: hypothetical protein [unclassified Paraburkholderia]PTR04325.1 hypothetical protein C8K19_101730 [Paraburkholderia sp. GV072]PUB09282.1 hypothetical protein C8K18_101805 [Paraburkholderia sp. GV068]
MDIKKMNSDELRSALAQAEKDVALYARLKAAGKLLAELQAEQRARAEAYAQEQASKLERAVIRWEVRGIEFKYATETKITDARQVTMFDKDARTEVKIALENMDAFQKAALLRVPEKLPADILALADTPEAALERWLVARRRGFLAQDRAYVSTLI